MRTSCPFSAGSPLYTSSTVMRTDHMALMPEVNGNASEIVPLTTSSDWAYNALSWPSVWAGSTGQASQTTEARMKRLWERRRRLLGTLIAGSGTLGLHR